MTGATEDVRELAMNALRTAIRDDRTGMAVKMSLAGEDKVAAFVEPIAAAIMTERKRCAAELRSISHQGMKGSFWREKFEQAADRIMKGGEA